MDELPSVSQTIRMALRLDSTVYTLVQGSRAGLTLALVVVFLAAISEAMGQSVVLFSIACAPSALRFPC